MLDKNIPKYFRAIEEKKNELKRIYPNSVIKSIPLGVLKKIGYIIELSGYSSLTKRELIDKIINYQAEHMAHPSDVEKTIIDVEYSSSDGVCKSLFINGNCDYVYYMMIGEKYK